MIASVRRALRKGEFEARTGSYPRTCRLIAAQPQRPLQAHGADPVLLAGDLPHHSEPSRQRLVAAVENRTVLSATTFWTFVHEFSPLELCAGLTNTASGSLRAPGDRLCTDVAGVNNALSLP